MNNFDWRSKTQEYAKRRGKKAAAENLWQMLSLLPDQDYHEARTLCLKWFK